MKKPIRIALMSATVVLLASFVSIAAYKSSPTSPEGSRFSHEYVVAGEKKDKALDAHHAVFELTFDEELLKSTPKDPVVELSCNGVIRRFELDQTLKYTLEVSPGKYAFQLYLDADHAEVITDSVAIAAGTRETLFIPFKPIRPEKPKKRRKKRYRREHVAYKPVIYVYSKQDRAVHIDLAPKGTFTFTYPAWNNGWEGTAHADGSMTIAGHNYPYLFWEGAIEGISELADYTSGFIVKKDEVTAFLGEKLTQMGLNDRERTDFITFWGPRMAASEQGFARFLFNKEYDAVAALNTDPKPESVFRVYLLWTPLESGTVLHPQPQELKTVSRTDFYVIEWGGSELSFPSIPAYD